MNTNWLALSQKRRIEILNQATELTGLPSVANIQQMRSFYLSYQKQQTLSVKSEKAHRMGTYRLSKKMFVML